MRIDDLMPSVKELIPFEYDRIGCDEYEKIIDEYLQKLSKGKKLIQVSGTPGSGKTTYCKKIAPHSYLSFDAIMENLPSYKADIVKYGNKKAFQRNEITARIIGYEILRRAIDNDLEIVFEHSGVNKAHTELFENLHKIGYKTESCFILCDLPTAIKRVDKREKETKRYTPHNIIKSRFLKIQKFLPKYEKLSDDTYVYDTTNNSFELKKHFCVGKQD